VVSDKELPDEFHDLLRSHDIEVLLA
jgi:hypothetical protein